VVEVALEHARQLAAVIGPRGSCTPAEKRAADYVCGVMSGLGLADVRVETYPGLRSAWQGFAIIYNLGLLGHLLYWGLGRSLPPLAFMPWVALCFWVGAWWFFRILTFEVTWLHRFLPKGASQNVIGIAPAACPARRRLVLIGHLDTHRTPWIFGGDTRTRLLGPLVLAGWYSLIAAPFAYGLGAFLGFPALAYLGLATLLFHVAGILLSVQADLSPFSPGANDNAAAAGVCLALAQRLKAEPLANTDVWVLASGCEESGLDGIRDFVNRHQASLAEALFLDFEGVGNGDHLVYLTYESPVKPEAIHPEALAIARRAAARCPHLEPVGAPAVGGYTEAGLVNHAGLRGLCLLTVPRGLKAIAEWHRPTDTFDRLRPEALARVQEFAWAVMQEWDRNV
jgi:hypothetical protein